MSKRVLLISANRCVAPDPVFPLGLAHLNAGLRLAGHDTRWHDLQIEDRPLEEVVTEYRPDLVGISLRNIDDVLIRKKETYYTSLAPICETVRRVAGCPVVLGGSGFSIFPRELLELSGAEYGVCGAGEAPLLALLEHLDRNGDDLGIPGLVYRQNGKIQLTPAAAEPAGRRLEVADRPPDVVAHYLRNGGMLNLQTQRGCTFGCCYCTYPLIEGRSHCRQPPEVVAEEFEQLQRLGAKYAFIVDSVFNSSPRHVTEVCEAIIRRNVKVAWGCFLRPQGLTRELMRLMGRAGLQHIEFGTDSLSNEVLAAYQKGFTFEEVLRSSELAGEARIDFCHFLISGGPGETRATLEEGFANSRRLGGAVIMAVVGMRVYPGTALYGRALAEGQIAASTELLRPVYYVTPALTPDEIFARLNQFAAESPNWIVGDPSPAYARLVERLRQRGVVGPLWSYLSMIQRLWPQPAG